MKNINLGYYIFIRILIVCTHEVLSEAPTVSRTVIALVWCPIVDYFTTMPIRVRYTQDTPIYPGQLPGRATATLPSCTCAFCLSTMVSWFRSVNGRCDRHQTTTLVIDILVTRGDARFLLSPTKEKRTKPRIFPRTTLSKNLMCNVTHMLLAKNFCELFRFVS